MSRAPRQSMTAAAAARQCRVCGAWLMTTTQRDAHEAKKHPRGQGRTRRPLEVGTGVIIREPGRSHNRFGVVTPSSTQAYGVVRVKVHMADGRTLVQGFHRSDLSIHGSK